MAKHGAQILDIFFVCQCFFKQTLPDHSIEQICCFVYLTNELKVIKITFIRLSLCIILWNTSGCRLVIINNNFSYIEFWAKEKLGQITKIKFPKAFPFCMRECTFPSCFQPKAIQSKCISTSWWIQIQNECDNASLNYTS